MTGEEHRAHRVPPRTRPDEPSVNKVASLGKGPWSMAEALTGPRPSTGSLDRCLSASATGRTANHPKRRRMAYFALQAHPGPTRHVRSQDMQAFPHGHPLSQNLQQVVGPGAGGAFAFPAGWTAAEKDATNASPSIHAFIILVKAQSHSLSIPNRPGTTVVIPLS